MYVAALSPQILEMIGRGLVRRGDLVFYLDTSDGLTLLPAQTHSIAGGPMPSGWVYDVTLAGPGELKTLKPVPAEAILHFRYGVDVERPWRGNSPLGVARAIGELTAEATTYLTQESAKPRGSFLSTPKGWRGFHNLGTENRCENGSGSMLFVEYGEQLGGWRESCGRLGCEALRSLGWPWHGGSGEDGAV